MGRCPILNPDNRGPFPPHLVIAVPNAQRFDNGEGQILNIYRLNEREVQELLRAIEGDDPFYIERFFLPFLSSKTFCTLLIFGIFKTIGLL